MAIAFVSEFSEWQIKQLDRKLDKLPESYKAFKVTEQAQGELPEESLVIAQNPQEAKAYVQQESRYCGDWNPTYKAEEIMAKARKTTIRCEGPKGHKECCVVSKATGEVKRCFKPQKGK